MPRFYLLAKMTCLFLAMAAVTVPLTAAGRTGGEIRVTVYDETGKLARDVAVELRFRGAEIAAAKTDSGGVASFPGLELGAYEIAVSKEGYETLTQRGLALRTEGTLEVEFMMVRKIELTDTVTVSGEITPIEQGATTAAELKGAQVKDLPTKPSTVTDALPMLPGVVRSPDGGIRISGSEEEKSALIVNSADVTDPVTGKFGMTVPVDSVQTVSVFKSPYLAEYGRFTAGVVAVETKRGGDTWNFEVNDPLPEFRIRSGHLQGLRYMTPRIVFDGPLSPGRLYLSEGVEYSLKKTPVRALSFPENEVIAESVNSFTQLDYNLSSRQTLTGTLHIAPQNVDYNGLDYFNPRPVTPNYEARDYTATVIDRLTIGKGLLDSTFAVKRFSGRVYGQGEEDMILSPTGNSGNYFSSQTRSALRTEWLEIYSAPPLAHYGKHNLKFGTTVARTNDDSLFQARTVRMVDTSGGVVRLIDFTGGMPFDRTDVELALFGQDHWEITPGLAMDFGTRVERQGITDTFRVAPRAGLVWLPSGLSGLTFRTGFGLFYDRVPLSVFSFSHYPEEIVTTFGPDGSITDGPRHFVNVTDTVDYGRFPFIYGSQRAGNFAPYSATWSAEAEHPVTRSLRLRVNYMQSHSNGQVIIEPVESNGMNALVLSGDGKSRYRQLEVTARLTLRHEREFFFSYVRSHSYGDINGFGNYLGNFPVPIIQPNRFAPSTGDLPNRFLAWGTAKLPWMMRIAPVVEYRNGFVYSNVDAARNYVGDPNSQRYPNFFSLDARVSKDIPVTQKYTFRFSVSCFNLTNHFNPLAVHSNIDDPQFGTFFSYYPRRFRVDFDVLF